MASHRLSLIKKYVRAKVADGMSVFCFIHMVVIFDLQRKLEGNYAEDNVAVTPDIIFICS